MKAESQDRGKYIIYGIGFYILLQFLWWEFLLVQQNREIMDVRKKLTALQYVSAEDIHHALEEQEKIFNRKLYMIIGEGTVFLIFLILGFYGITFYRKKELHLQKEKEHFYYGITHELKTPIASLQLQLQTLQKLYPGEPEKHPYIMQAVSDAGRINLLINNLLHSRQMMYGEILPHFEELLLSEEWPRWISHLTRAHPHRIKEFFCEDFEHLTLSADREMCKSIVGNFIENALRYSPESSTVIVRWENENDLLKMTVCNQGEPLPEEFRKNLFKPFVSKTSSLKGTGLGLFVAFTFAEKMGHQIQYNYTNNEHHFLWIIKKVNCKNKK